MRVSGTVRWFGLALLGILIAAGVAFAASRLASQQIGLASEPISAGDALAPRAKAPGRPGKRPRHSAPATTPSVTTPPATTTAPPHPTPTPETIAPEPQPEVPSHAGGGDGEHRGAGHGGGHADD